MHISWYHRSQVSYDLRTISLIIYEHEILYSLKVSHYLLYKYITVKT